MQEKCKETTLMALLPGVVAQYLTLKTFQNPLIFNDENSCKYIGSAKYSTNSERVNVVLGYKSCFINNQLIESDIKGFVTENLMSGVKAKVEYSNKIVAELLPGRNVELFITEVKSSKNININEITRSAK